MKTTSLAQNAIACALLLFMFQISSCDDEKEEMETVEPTVVIPKIKFDNLSERFFFIGDVLAISGENFLHENYETELYVNGQLINISPDSNQLIEIPITDEMASGNNTFHVKIDNVQSDKMSFFLMSSGWQKINAFESNDIVKSYVFESSNKIFSLVDIASGPNSYYAIVKALHADSLGYEEASVDSPGANLSDLKMYDDQVGVAAGGMIGYFTTNSFQSSTTFGDLESYAFETQVSFISTNSCIIADAFGGHVFTEDMGSTSFVTQPFNYLRKARENGASYYGTIKSRGQSTSGDYYALGYFYRNQPHRNLVIKSSNGYDAWEMVDSTTLHTNMSSAKFIDEDLILSKTAEDVLVSSEDLGVTWSDMKTEVESFFIKSKSEWYIVSNDNLLFTNDSGSTWSVELELPKDSEVNHIHFSESKTILSGNAGLLYIKHD
ncbi:hypothetical protein [Reichenbachiella sp.]|uniref:WD40/YVTN/BNR-like repeat-containing protein n=1 Tax=Reichenbachiella sp. TaxID=2184521 RepID=UPI003299B09E